jgi:hypothetical protein
VVVPAVTHEQQQPDAGAPSAAAVAVAALSAALSTAAQPRRAPREYRPPMGAPPPFDAAAQSLLPPAPSLLPPAQPSGRLPHAAASDEAAAAVEASTPRWPCAWCFAAPAASCTCRARTFASASNTRVLHLFSGRAARRATAAVAVRAPLRLRGVRCGAAGSPACRAAVPEMPRARGLRHTRVRRIRRRSDGSLAHGEYILRRI